MEFEIEDENELPRVAEELVKKYPGPAVFLVEGEMGAGKTTFIRAVCAHLGATGASSPTFSLINEYETTGGEKIFHADMYRVKSREEALQFGFEEYPAAAGYFFIEWPDVVRSLVPDGVVIRIETRDSKRIIRF
ncbi:MAG: tRNA (adenosine(37)-N6)-threonylcarbamoyltransferase complex ATPase subunit type 1 TsaE [Nitrospirota bacterium]|nr:tRNA (adenosine(37)-N6)-threonylcarbamoyltransferase complex ATPase subunit type 1 TsaE [Nitrospirota bacterium]